MSDAEDANDAAALVTATFRNPFLRPGRFSFPGTAPHAYRDDGADDDVDAPPAVGCASPSSVVATWNPFSPLESASCVAPQS